MPAPIAARFVAPAPDTERFLAERWQAARDRWPGVELSPDCFWTHVTTHLGAALGAVDALALLRDVHWEELYLTLACREGDNRALAHFEANYFPIVVAALARMGLDRPRIDELTQRLRAHLLVGDGERAPRIGDYAGRGELGSWVRVAAVREALKLIRREQRERPTENDRLAELSTNAHDVESRYLKRLYGRMFKEAFAEALSTLPSAEKNLLRQHYLDGLTIEQIGRLRRRDRGTVARWLDRIRQTLHDRTRRAVMQRARLSQSACDSLFELVRSQLDLSLSHLLRPAS
jgi:RNA polymerase sigma-70 factor (ECF subfamily)